jgi:hypothetical protein
MIAAIARTEARNHGNDLLTMRPVITTNSKPAQQEIKISHSVLSTELRDDNTHVPALLSNIDFSS